MSSAALTLDQDVWCPKYNPWLIAVVVATSMVTTLIARRSQFHQEILGDYVRAGSFNLQNAANGLAQRLANSGLGTHEAQQQAYARIYQLVQVQAASLALDTFLALAVISAIMFFLAFLLKKNEPGSGGTVAVE